MPDDTAIPVHRIAFSFPAETASIGEVRHLILSEAQTLPFTVEELDDIALAISEAFTNLVQHAGGNRIRGVCEVSAHQLEVRFEIEASASQHIARTQLPAGLSIGGRGIPLLHLLLPTVEILHHPDGAAELRLVKPVSGLQEGH